MVRITAAHASKMPAAPTPLLCPRCPLLPALPSSQMPRLRHLLVSRCIPRLATSHTHITWGVTQCSRTLSASTSSPPSSSQFTT